MVTTRFSDLLGDCVMPYPLGSRKGSSNLDAATSGQPSAC
jgi:hypothetical protein